MIYISKTESILLNRLFKFDYNENEKHHELHYHPAFPMLLSGKRNLPEKDHSKYLSLSSAPEVIKKRFTKVAYDEILNFIKVKNYEKARLNLTFEEYFLERLKELFQDTGHAEGYRDYQPIYASYDYLTAENVVEFAKLHAIIILISKFSYDSMKLRFIYQHLCEYNYGVKIHLTSFESFQKYLKRKRDTLPKSLIHKHFGMPSNNHEITELMQFVVVLLSNYTPTRRAFFSIKEDLDHIIETMPNTKTYGIYSLSESKIATFLKEPKAQNLISFAKDNPTEFRRRVSGIIRFTRASAPLVRIYIDGYVFQVEYKNGKKPHRLTGIFISDDYSDFIISHKIGQTENYELLMSALQKYFEKTKNALAREIVVDRYTFKILSKNKAFIELLKRYGIEKGKGLIVSSNPNRKSRLERFFNTFQQKFMHALIGFIGPGIMSRRSHSHPFKEFRLTLQKNLPDKFDLILILDKLVNINYNKDYISPTQSTLSTPENRFKHEEDHNPVATIEKGMIPILFYERHSVTFKAGAVMIKKGNKLNIYYDRGFEFVNNFNGIKMDAFIDPDSDEKVIFLYEEGTTRLINQLLLSVIIPVASFDRNEHQKEVLKNFTKQTQELIKKFEAEFEKMEETVRLALNGRDLREFTKLAEMKKESSIDQKVAEEMNLKEHREEPKLFHANKSRRKTRGQSQIQQLGIDILDTF